MAQNQQMGVSPEDSPKHSSSWGKLLLFVIIIVAILAIVFYYFHTATKQYSVTKAPPSSGPSKVVINPKLAAGGITAGLVMNQSSAAAQSPFYTSTNKDGSLQTDTSLISSMSLPQIRTYYMNYFQNDGWAGTSAVDDLQAPADPSSAITLIYTKLLSDNSVQTATVNASAIKGSQNNVVRITTFISPSINSSH